MRQQIKKWASLVLSITLMLYSFGGCAKRERDPWMMTISTGMPTKIEESSKLYQDLIKIIPDEFEISIFNCYNARREGKVKWKSISLLLHAKDDTDFINRMKNNEEPGERDEELWKAYVKLLKNFEKKVLGQFSDKVSDVSINCLQSGSYGIIADVVFNRTVKGTWSWKLREVGDISTDDEEFENRNGSWKRLLDDKFLTRHYQYDEEPEYDYGIVEE